MLSAQQLAHTHDLNLVIRHLLAGLGHGIHAGKERGAGVEFSEYRAYAPGDEWRRIDWKLMARTDRYFIREAERDSHVAVWLCLDASTSMLQRSQRATISKWHSARIIAATLAAIAQRQGDAVGVLVLHDERIQVVPALRGARHLHRIFAQLQRTEPKGKLPAATTWRSIYSLTRLPAVMFAISDFLDRDSTLLRALFRWRAAGHDVRALALQSDIERDALLADNSACTDGEQTEQWHHFLQQDKSIYLQGYQQHYHDWQQQMRAHNIAHYVHSIETAPETIVRHCLAAERPSR
jgi:uncharacterized protein (DUF58 family)